MDVAWTPDVAGGVVRGELSLATAPTRPLVLELTLTLGDEVLTPDSSRFWPADDYEPGRGQASFDKQYVRDWLHIEASGWNGEGLAPALPADVVEPTRARYIEAFERLTGRSFSPQGPFLEVDAVD